MTTATLRKVGGSVMVAIPTAFLQQLNLSAGESLDLAIEGGRLTATPRPRPRYRLQDLIAASAQTEPSDEDAAWLNDQPEGGELL